MEILEFYLTVLPLGFIIGFLVPLVWFYARREERAQWKLKKTMRTYVKERVKQKEIYTRGLEHLNTLLNNGSLDASTYERLKLLLEANYQRKQAETAKQYTHRVPTKQKSSQWKRIMRSVFAGTSSFSMSFLRLETQF